MRKSFVYLILGIFCLGILTNSSKAQFTAPETVLGLHINGNFATNEGYGVGSAIYGGNFSGATYGMKYGRGVGLDFSYGFGKTKRNRLTLGVSWDAMVNANTSAVPFLLISPDEPVMTYYNIFGGSVGYQYMFNARCYQKQWIGIALTASVIGAPRYSVVNFENAFRGGVAFSSGYDWVLDSQGKWGISVYGKYHIVNAFFHENSSNPGGLGHINDGNGQPGAGYDRYMGLLSINLAINMYGGVKSLTGLMK